MQQKSPDFQIPLERSKYTFPVAGQNFKSSGGNVLPPHIYTLARIPHDISVSTADALP